MKNLVKSISAISLAVALAACNKDSGGGGHANPLPPGGPVPYQNGYGLNQQGNLNPDGPLLPAPQVNPASQDITYDGRVLNRQIRFFSGAIFETVEDSCQSLTYRHSRPRWFMLNTNAQNLLLTFDQTGYLTITLKSQNGVATSNGPVMYHLDAGTQSIVIEKFQLSGAPSQAYVSGAIAKGRYNQMMTDRRALEEDYVSNRWNKRRLNNYNDSQLDYNSMGAYQANFGVQDQPYQFGSTVGNGNSVGFATSPQGGNYQNANPNQNQSSIAVESTSATSIRLTTTKSNFQDHTAQHIFAGVLEEPLHLQTFVTVSGPENGCYTKVSSDIKGFLN